MIDLRQELRDLIKNSFDSLIFRHKTGVKCNCWRPESNTIDPDCNRCQGLGWIFTEFIQKCKYFLIDTQRVSHLQDFNFGKSYSNAFTVYVPITRKTRELKIDDIIYTVKVDYNGNIVKPIKRLKKWSITDCIELHLDNGKPEFIQIIAKPLDV